ncbi:hypothetical protein TESG_08296 [Trichophyton tonsurans CBS 112818]|uniref:Uncharacterized protein n=1 Tax=Trichophyton tonsurans (strain CBS 112818) TaxID=647933 RepID=F2RQW1_TRIT1|nr:hypothetical protein TESG_08296 [Trichophyton tonsurans CBS 112818]
MGLDLLAWRFRWSQAKPARAPKGRGRQNVRREREHTGSESSGQQRGGSEGVSCDDFPESGCWFGRGAAATGSVVGQGIKLCCAVSLRTARTTKGGQTESSQSSQRSQSSQSRPGQDENKEGQAEATRKPPGRDALVRARLVVLDSRFAVLAVLAVVIVGDCCW